jgi:hypothetical protein
MGRLAMQLEAGGPVRRLERGRDSKSAHEGGQVAREGGAGRYAAAQIGGEGSLAQRVAEPCELSVQGPPIRESI